jgi:hypothetical protein
MLPASMVAARDWRIWSEFAWNTRKHADAFTGNLTGLRAVMSYDHDTRLAITAPLETGQDPFRVWLDFRHRTVARRWIPHLALTVAMTLIVLAALRGQPPWVAAVLGIGLTPIVTAVSSYYYSFLLLFGLLGWRRPAIGSALCVLAAATHAVPYALEHFDERFTATSVLILAFVVFASLVLVRRPSPLPETGVPQRHERGAHASAM